MTKSHNKGFSIVEMIVYLAIFTLISVLVINSFIVVASSFSATRTNRDLMESGQASMERIAREIRQADAIDVPNSTLGSTPGILELDSTDSGGSPLAIKFMIVSGALNVYKAGVLSGNLLAPNISITSLIFRRITTTQGEAIKIEMTLSDTRSKTTRTENFYNTIIVRGGY